MPSRPSLILPALLTLAPFSAAQSAPHAPTCPGVFAGHAAPGADLLPHARSGGLIQHWFRGDCFDATQLVTSIGVRPQETIAPAANTQSMEITFDNVAYGFSGLTNTFAANFSGNQTVVFPRQTINLPILWMPLSQPWVFLGPHFLVQFDLGPATGAVTTSHQVDGYLMATSGTSATLHTRSNPSCGGTLGSSYDTATSSVLLSTSSAPPFAAVVYMIGASNRRFAGAVPLPLLLDFLGIVGCYLGVDPLIWVASSANASGQHTLTLPYVLTPESTVVHTQVLHTTTANPVGIATTNLANTVLGWTGLSNYCYNWTIDGPVSQFGPYTSNRGPVLLFRP